MRDLCVGTCIFTFGSDEEQEVHSVLDTFCCSNSSVAINVDLVASEGHCQLVVIRSISMGERLQTAG